MTLILGRSAVIHGSRASFVTNRCRVCQRPASRQCDFKLSNGRECDEYLCSGHAISAGPGIDHCPGHPEVKNTLALSP